MNNTKSESHWYMSSVSVAIALLSTFLPIILVRLLEVDQIADYKIFFLYTTFIPTLTIASGLIHGLPFWSSKDSNIPIIQAGYILVNLYALSLTIILVFINQIFNVNNIYGNQYTNLLFIFCILPLANQQIIEELLIAKGKIKLVAILFGVFEFARISTMVMVAYLSGNVNYVLIAFLIITFNRFIILLFTALKLKLISLKMDFSNSKLFIYYSLPITFALILALLTQYADQLILSKYLAKVDFAFYSIGCLIIPPIFIYEQSVTRVIIPKISSALAQANNLEALDLLKGSISNLSILIIPASFALSIFAEPIIILLFTEKYEPAVNVLRIFAFTYIFFSIPFDAIPRAAGDRNWLVSSNLFFSLINIIITLLGLYLFGIYGVLFSQIILRCSMRIYSMYYVRAKFKLDHFYQIIPTEDLKRYFIATSIACLFSIIIRIFINNIFIWLFMGGFVYTYVYFKCLKIFANKTCYKNVIHITQSLEIGGIEKQIVDICSAMKNNFNFNPAIFAYDHPKNDATNELEVLAQNFNIPTFIFNKKSGFSIKTIIKLSLLVNERKIGILHTHDLGGLIYASFVKVFNLNNLRIIHTQHSFVHLEKKYSYLLFEYIFSRFADQITCVSDQVFQTYLDKSIRKNNITLIPNGIKIEISMPTLLQRNESRKILKEIYSNLDCERYWILQVARFHEIKGQARLLDLWNKLPNNLKDRCQLILAGPVSDEEYYSKLRSNVIDQSVVIIPHTVQPVRFNLAAHVITSASRSEGLPISILEGLCIGNTALLSNIPGHQHFYKQSKFFDLLSANEYANRLSEILDEYDNSESQKFNDNWEKSSELRKQYSIEINCLKFEKLYSENNDFKLFLKRYLSRFNLKTYA